MNKLPTTEQFRAYKKGMDLEHYLKTNTTRDERVYREMTRRVNYTLGNLKNYLSTGVSVGQTTGGMVSDNGNGTVTVAAGTGYIKKTDSSTGELVAFEWAENDSVSLTNNSVNYILVKYNNGKPIIESTDDFNSINFHTEFVVGLVYREGTDVKILQAGNRLPDAQIRFCTQKYLRGIEHVSGGAIGEKATRYVTATAGVFYIGDTRIDTSAFDSSTENFEHYYYRDGAGGWNDATATGQIDNTHYDDGSGTLAELTTNRYGVHWVYISFEGKLSVVYGQGNYKYNEAVLAQPPSSIPDYLNTFAILAAKIVIQKNASSFNTIESAFVKVFVPEDTLDHNDLASLQGGTSGEYYHLTSAEHSWLDNVTLSDDGTIVTNSYIGVGGSIPGGLTGANKLFIDTELSTGKSRLFCYGKDANTRGQFEVTLRESDEGGSIAPFLIKSDGGVVIANIKSGATQAAAGAAAGEIWKTSGHSSLPDNVLMLGV